MPVMTSLSPDSVLDELKAQPVPSSDKMALDIDINGTSNHDEPSRDLATPDPSMTSSSEAAQKPSTEGANGTENTDAFEASNAMDDSVELPGATVETQTIEVIKSTEIVSPSGIANTLDASESLTTSLPTTTLPESVNSISHSHALSEEQLDAIDILPPATSSVPPVVEAQESDLREDIVPATEEQAVEAINEKHNLDLSADSALALDSGDTSLNDPSDSTPAVPNLEASSDPATLPSSLDEHPLHPDSVSNIDLNKAPQPDLPAIDSTQEDVSMVDAPPSPIKVAREREEDTEDDRAAKRTKTEDNSADFAISDAPAAAPASETAEQNGDSVAAAHDDRHAMTPYQQKEILKAVKQQKNTVAGRNFKDAVATLWPTLGASYLEKISNPIDLLIMENRLKEGSYATIGDFKNDLTLLYENCVIYNGPDHVVTKAAATVQTNIINKIPGPEPIKVEKKPRKSTPIIEAPPPRKAAQRRQSRGSAAPAGSTAAATPAQTFALDPSGTPIIRRDSTKNDSGRPKRDIHPPKTKDIIYNARPKKKKFAQELKFCNDVLTELQKSKYAAYNTPFLAPVDPVALGIPDYFKIIKNPMDLSTVAKKLTMGQYENAKDFETDVRLIFKNCYRFNPPGSAVNEMGKSLEGVFDAEWAKKGQWMADHPGPSNAASPASTGDDDDDESSEDDVEEEPAQAGTSALHERLIEEQNKLIDMLASKKPEQSLIRMQQEMVAIIKKSMDEENAKLAKTKPKSKAKAPKKVANSKKKAEPSKKPYHVKKITLAEKEQISAGIVQLEGKVMEQAIALLKMDMPNLNIEEEDELDIDQFTLGTLSRLHDLIIKHVPSVVPVKQEPVRTQKQSRPKKNKPMSKTEQEAKIEKLKALQDQFERQGSTSDEAPARRVVPSVEQEDQSSGDESPSDSEED